LAGPRQVRQQLGIGHAGEVNDRFGAGSAVPAAAGGRHGGPAFGAGLRNLNSQLVHKVFAYI
jgi:hypothetical protein